MQGVGLGQINRAMIAGYLQAARLVEPIQILFAGLYGHVSDGLGGLFCAAGVLIDVCVEARLGSKPFGLNIDLQDPIELLARLPVLAACL